MRIIKVLVTVLFISGCEKSENIEDFLFKTWDLEWKQCGIYQNKYDAQINFTQTDSADFGWFIQKGEDTVRFNFKISSNEQITLTEVSDTLWKGVLTINRISTAVFDFEKEVQECENERYHFK